MNLQAIMDTIYREGWGLDTEMLGDGETFHAHLVTNNTYVDGRGRSGEEAIVDAYETLMKVYEEEGDDGAGS